MRFIRRAQKHIAIFISHSERDNDEAQHYAELLSRAGFAAFQYSEGLQFGKEINSVSDEIGKCHFFFFIISDHSLKSRWVQRELGLAIELRKKTGGYKPIIVPLYAEHASWRTAERPERPKSFPTRDFVTGQGGDPFDLGIRGFDKYSSPTADTEKRLAEHMKPYLIVSKLDFDDESTFFRTEVFTLYDEIFPAVEQDGHQDIMDWVLRTDIGEKRSFRLSDGTALTYTLDSKYFILCLAGRAIGLSFVTYDHASRLLYGNYIAVQKLWRDGDVAKAFMTEIMRVAEELFPDQLGAIFEVETFDRSRIKEIIDHLEKSGGVFRSEEEDRDQIRKFLRVCWYQSIECVFFIDNESQEPVVFTSPSLDSTSEGRPWESREVEYWIMWRGRKGIESPVEPAQLWRQAANTIWIEILAKSLVEAFPNTGVEYWRYANAVVERTLNRLESKRIAVGKYGYRHTDGLYERWIKLKIDIAI